MKTLSTRHEHVSGRAATVLEAVLAAVVSGALLAFALPPFDVPQLGFVALAPVMAAVWRASLITALLTTLLMAVTTCTVMTGILSGDVEGMQSATFGLVYFVVFGGASLLPLRLA